MYANLHYTTALWGKDNRAGYFDKQDVARYLGVKQNHIDKFMWEVSKW